MDVFQGRHQSTLSTIPLLLITSNLHLCVSNTLVQVRTMMPSLNFLNTRRHQGRLKPVSNQQHIFYNNGLYTSNRIATIYIQQTAMIMQHPACNTFYTETEKFLHTTNISTITPPIIFVIAKFFISLPGSVKNYFESFCNKLFCFVRRIKNWTINLNLFKWMDILLHPIRVVYCEKIRVFSFHLIK